jgi:hypothetical protein
MEWLQLDEVSSERLLSGALDPDDAPPGFAGVAALLRAAGASAGRSRPGRAADQNPTTPSPKERLQVAAMVAAMSAGTPDGRIKPEAKPRRPFFTRARACALLVATMLFGGTGLALAGALPAPLQNAAASVLSKVGISVPHSHFTSFTPSNTTPAAPSKGPDLNGPARFGLCNAFSSGQGSVHGNKDSAVPFQNLQKAARAAGQSVEEFCKAATPGGKTSRGQSDDQSGHERTGNPSGQQGHQDGSGRQDQHGKKDGQGQQDQHGH